MSDSEGCLDCGRGLHKLCGEHECCIVTDVAGSTNSKNPSNVGSNADEKDLQSVGRSDSPDAKKPRGRPTKSSEDIQDVKSTGRKRAAVLFPLSSGSPCEWRSLSNCGGGKFPIIGCIQGLQQHRHHGPNKDTLENTVGNVHRICDDCHNIWHSQNNKDYDPTIKHNPRPATHEELTDRAMKIRYCV